MSLPTPPPTFTPSLFARSIALLSTLLSSSSSSDGQPSAKEVYAELEKVKLWLCAGLSVPARKESEKKEVESGSLKIGSKTISLDATFITDSLQLSSTLNLSELVSASLHRSALANVQKYSRPALDTGVLMFEAERLDKLELLKILFDPSWRDRQGEQAEVVRRFAGELRGTLVALDGGKEGSLVERLMVDLDLLKVVALDVRAAVSKASLAVGQQPPPPTSNPSLFNSFAPPPPAATTATSSPDAISLDVQKERLSALRAQRQGLGHVLFLMQVGGMMRKKEVQSCVRWLSRQSGVSAKGKEVEVDAEEEQGVLGYFISTVLAAFEMGELKHEDADHERIIQEKFLKDTQFIKIMTAEIVEKPWKHKPLQSFVTLQWTLYLVTAFRYNSNLSSTIQMTEEVVESLVQNAIRSDALQFATDDVVRRTDLVDETFKWYLLSQVDLLVANFVTTMSPILRKLKHREEDAIFNPPSASAKSLSASGRRSLGGPVPAANATGTAGVAPRADIEGLFTLISALYTDCPPDAALKYWTDRPDGRLFAFLRWAADSRVPGMIRALSDMLASLSGGQQCATFAFGFLAAGGEDGGNVVCSWSSLFEALQFYAQQLPKINERSQVDPVSAAGLLSSGSANQQRRDPNAPSTVPPDELALLTSFLRLLKNVVQFSPVARAALHENQAFRAIPTLLSLVNSVVPIEFKAALFDTLAAFCGPEGGSLGQDIARQMWFALERFELVPAGVKSAPFGGLYRSSASLIASRAGGGAGGRAGSGGIIAEFEDAEVEASTYPATAAFVNLLNTLIHTPAKNATLLSGFEAQTQTIPDNLGAANRQPGIGPYVRYVLHEVLLRAPKLAFANPAEQWTLIERSLCFVEKCLVTYDLSPVLLEEVSAAGIGARSTHSKAGIALVGLASHPGFDVLKKLLTEPALLKSLFDVVQVGLDGLLEDGGQTPLKTKAVLRALRIVHRILQIQSLFIEVLLPTLVESAAALGLNPSSFPSNVAPLDQHLLYTHAIVVQIALFVNFAEEQELVLLAVKIVAQLSQSPFFRAVDRFENIYSSHMNRLVGIVDSSDESLRILDGFVRRLESEGDGERGWSSEDDPIQALVSSDSVNPNADDQTEVIRSAVLDLLLANTTVGTPGPNIAHFLCGLPLNASASDVSIDDPQAQGANLSCLHIVLELLAQGTHAPGDKPDFAEQSLLGRNPALAEKCARLVYQLCTHELTGPATTRYVRTREEYCSRQLAVFPMVAPAAPASVSLGQVVYPDGGAVNTSAGALTSFLRYRSSVLDAVALELHTVNPTGLHAAKLVDNLFAVPKEFEELNSNRMDTAEQPLIRVLDILLSMDFQWQDDIPDLDIKLTFFANFDFGTCLAVNAAGCEVYDFRALVSALNVVRRKHQAMGSLSSASQQEALQTEIRGILLTLAAENHQREIAHAKYECLVSWQRVLDVVLFKSFELIPVDERETALFDLIQAAFHLIALPDWPSSAAELLCQVVLSLITRLRHGRHEAALSGETSKTNAGLPTDKLHAILKGVLEGIVRAGTTQLVRGNLYTVLINYLQIITPSPSVPSTDGSAASKDTLLLEGSVSGQSSSSGQAASSLEAGSLSILLSTMDRVVPIICRDALDGSEIWKTVAYAALETLLAASASDRSYKLVGILYRNGYLQSFIQSLKDSENDLRAILSTDPENLNAYYVYEAKTSLLLRIAESRAGAERLLDARLLDVLTQCYFIEDRPEIDQTMFDIDTFLPPVFERYHQILLPVLQLVSVVSSSLGPTSNAAVIEALSFLNAHRDTILGLLRDPVGKIPLSTIKELHLLATIFTQVLPTVESQDLGLSSGFGAYHNALLHLASRFFLREKWEDLTVPLNDAERADAEKPAPSGKQNGSLFDFNTDNAVEDLNASLLSYFVLATETRGSAPLRPVFTPSVSTRETGLLPKGGGPSILSAVVLLYETVSYLRTTVDQFASVSDKIAQPKMLTNDEIEEIVLASRATEDLPTKFNAAQSQRLAVQVLVKTQASLKKRAALSLLITETLLLLLWRHLLFFINESLQDGPAANWATIPPQSVSLRFSQGPGAVDGYSSSRRTGASGLREMWERVSEELHPALGKLERMELPVDIFGADTPLKTSFLAVLSRRLRELDLAAEGAD